MTELRPEFHKYQGKDIKQALDGALVTVQSFCQWHIAPSIAGATASVWSRDGYTIFLPTLALTAVTSVVQDAVTIAAANYTFERYGVIRCVPGQVFSRLSKLTVTFTHGYAALPADVQDIVLLAAQRSVSDTRGLVPRISGGPAFMENRGPRLEPDDKERLSPYVLAGFA